MTQNNANNRVVNELLMPLKKRSGAMIGWGYLLYRPRYDRFICAYRILGRRHDLYWCNAFGFRCNRLALFWKAEGWGARTAAIVLALLTALTGLLLMFYPIAGTETLTLFLASYFIAIGLVKCWAALSNTDAKGWGLMLFSAIISLLLGRGCLWWGWPQSATWIFGIFVAIELIFDGWTALIFGLEVRALPGDDSDNK